jgi:hypothetical protein
MLLIPYAVEPLPPVAMPVMLIVPAEEFLHPSPAAPPVTFPVTLIVPVDVLPAPFD